jgi:beta-lactamase class A
MPPDEELSGRLEALRAEHGAAALAVAVHDHETGFEWELDGDRSFHAASTIKLAVLVALFEAIDRGELSTTARLHVRNRFRSAVGGRWFRVDAGRDANAEVHRFVGRTMRVGELARHMIVTSSNLATNVLVHFLGVDAIREAVDRLGVRGVDVRRGVEDERAWEAGLSNHVTARGLVDLLDPLVDGEGVSAEASRAMLDILHDQEFRSGIPAGAPDGARVANKTGEISTVAHDAGIVFPADRKPYVLAVLTGWETDAGNDRRALIAAVSRELAAVVLDGSGAPAGDRGVAGEAADG